MITQFEAIKALMSNAYNIEQMGVFEYYDGSHTFHGFFGEGAFGLIDCAILNGDRFIYQYDYGQGLEFGGHEPDVYYNAEDGSEIGLYKLCE